MSNEAKTLSPDNGHVFPDREEDDLTCTQCDVRYLDRHRGRCAGRAAPQVQLEHPGLAVLRDVLKRMRWDDQGGYVGYEGDGKWSFVSTSLPSVTSEELNALFDLVGIKPDVIEPLGECKNCAHALNGRGQGYKGPCLTCKCPRMSNFVQLKTRRPTT